MSLKYYDFEIEKHYHPENFMDNEEYQFNKTYMKSTTKCPIDNEFMYHGLKVYSDGNTKHFLMTKKNFQGFDSDGISGKRKSCTYFRYC